MQIHHEWQMSRENVTILGTVFSKNQEELKANEMRCKNLTNALMLNDTFSGKGAKC